MAWIKLDDQWMRHPKIVRAGRDARDVWLASLTWCAEYLTDGYFPAELLPALAVTAGVDVANCQQFASILVDVCLWERTENGYYIHDYTDYNPTKEQAEATKKARSEAGRHGGKAKAAQSKQNPGNLLDKSEAKSKQNPAPSPSPSLNQEQEAADAAPVSKRRKPTLPPGSDIGFFMAAGMDIPEPPKEKPIDLEWVPADIQEMMREFMECTGLPKPPTETERGYWISSMRDMRLLDELTPDDIRLGIQKARRKDTLIKSPDSIRTSALDVRGANRSTHFAEVY